MCSNKSKQAVHEAIKKHIQAILEKAKVHTQKVPQEASQEVDQDATQKVFEEELQKVSQVVIHKAFHGSFENVSIQNIPKDSVQNTPEEAPQEVGQDASDEMPQVAMLLEVSEEESQEAFQKIHQIPGQKTPQEATLLEVTEEEHQKIPQDIIQKGSQETFQKLSQNSSQKVSQDSIQKTLEDAPQEVCQDASEKTPQVATLLKAYEEEFQKIPQDVIRKGSQVPARKVLQVPAQKVPEIPAHKVPQVPAQKVPQITAQKVLHVPAQKVPQITAHKVPQVPVQKVPQITAQKVLQVPAQKVPQITAQKVPQISAQKGPQITAQKVPQGARKKTPQKAHQEIRKRQSSTEGMTDEPNVKEPQFKDINILLLGETGVGKSTFINSIFNYLQYQDFTVAELKKLNVLIPAMFSMFDKDGQLQTIRIGASGDKNESREIGESATQGVRTYIFLIKNGEYRIRLIDTPGMGDTRGIEQDDLNCENILNYISGIRELHAICYLCKSQQTRATSYFQYCMAQIMTRLHADACKNFVFVFTGCKAENYMPGETIQILKKITDEISKKSVHVKLKLDDNKFCFDNEAFRYLAAIKHGVKLSPEVRSDAIESWSRATQESWQMIDYITKLRPHFVQHTSAINEARRLIYQLSKPMADIAQLVQDNITLLQRHNHHMAIETSSIQELQQKLYIPSIKLQVTMLDKPVTVCADIKCCELYKVDDRNEYHYKTRCHDPCYLSNVQREVIGAPELMNCSTMNPEQLCNKCGCSYRVHMHVYYFTKKNSVNKPDESVLQNINTREHAIQKIKVLIINLKERQQQYERELDIITKANAKFAHFLEKNAVAAFTDAYAEYIGYLIIREKSLGKLCNISNLTALETLLRQHNEQKKIFDNAAQRQEKVGGQGLITPKHISQTMSQLFGLPLSGKDIKAMYVSQKTAREKEHTNTEYIHNVTFNKAAKKLEAKNCGTAPIKSPKNRQNNQSEVHVRNITPPPSYDASQQQGHISRYYVPGHFFHPLYYTPPPSTSYRPPVEDYQSRYNHLLHSSAEIMRTMANNLGYPSSMHNRNREQGIPISQNMTFSRQPPYYGQGDYDQNNQYHNDTGHGENNRNFPVYDRDRYVWTKKS